MSFSRGPRSGCCRRRCGRGCAGATNIDHKARNNWGGFNMRFRSVPDTPEKYAGYLRWLRGERRKEKKKAKRKSTKRHSLTAAQRKRVLSKTGARCHICGGKIKDRWQADHVFPHSVGGGNHADNYLAAHVLCNNYRWDYVVEEFQQILKLGVWVRTQIEKQTGVGRQMALGFTKYERRRRRRKTRGKDRAAA